MAKYKKKKKSPRGEASYISEYRFKAKGRKADRKRITSLEVFQPKAPEGQATPSTLPAVQIDLRIQETEWAKFQKRLLIRKPFEPMSAFTYGVSYLPLAVSFFLRNHLPTELAIPAIALGVAGRAVIPSAINKIPYMKNRLKRIWDENTERTIGGVFNRDEILEKTLGTANAHRFQKALAEAITFAERNHHSNKTFNRSPLAKFLGYESPTAYMGYRAMIEPLDFSQINFTPKPDSDERFSFYFHMKGQDGKDNLTRASIQIVPDIQLYHSFEKHGHNTLASREINPETGLEIEEKPIHLRFPIDLPEPKTQAPSPEKLEALSALMFPPKAKKGQAQTPEMWFHVRGNDVYITTYQPDTVPATMAHGAYCILKEHSPEILPAFRQANKGYKKAAKRWKAARQDLKDARQNSVLDQEQISKLEDEIKTLETELAKIGGRFSVKKARLAEDGLPPSDPSHYEEDKDFIHANVKTVGEFLKYVEDKITNKGFEKTYFWWGRRFTELQKGLDYDDSLRSDIERTLKVLDKLEEDRNHGFPAQIYVDQRKGGVYVLRPHQGRYELRVGSLKKNMLPPKLDKMDILVAGEKEAVMSTLGGLKPHLIENPYHKLADYKAQMEEALAQEHAQARGLPYAPANDVQPLT